MRQLRFNWSVLFSLLALVALTSPSQARVGVTSGAEGDPLGKPPGDAERILRVGIDIQPDELISTGTDDRAHVVFLDGTSLTVGPNARIKVDKFVYDPTSQRGDIAISVAKGVFRVVGGKITKSQAMTVTTPSAVIGIRGGIALLEVSGQETRAQFLFGKSLLVSAQGRSETATRPGSEIATRYGAFPGPATLVPVGALTSVLGQLDVHPKGLRSDGTPDERARDSGFSDQNSGRGPPSQAVTPTVPGAATNAVNTVGVQRNQPLPIATMPIPPVPPAPALAPSTSLPAPLCRDDRDFRYHHFHHRR